MALIIIPKMKYFLGLIFLLYIACDSHENSYENEVLEWRKERIENLTAPISWSSLSGLYWLKEGENILGSSKEANIKFPKEADPILGKIIYSNDSISFSSSEGIVVLEADSLVTEVLMIPDSEENTTRLNSNSYYFTAINRDDKIGIRIWDTLHVARTLYKSLDYYPIDPKMNIKARYITYDEPKIMKIKNVLGMDFDRELPGHLEFQMHGEKFKIEPLDGGPDDFFLIFADETTGGNTYGGGRYLYCSKPDKDGNTFIDFNKAYTPPCGFTAFATCLLPTKANTLAIEIRAGEKYDGSH